MRYTGPKEKLSRRIGENLGLKAERSYSPKSSFLKKPYWPGMHGKSRRRALSEFGIQLLEKQKLKFTYGISEKQLRKYFNISKQSRGMIGNMLLGALEQRLDNVIFRSGFARSRNISRQLVSHGHFLVNNKRINIPSYEVKTNDTIVIKPHSRPKQIFFGLSDRLKKYEIPSWIEVDKKNLEIKIKNKIEDDDLPKNFNVSSIMAFYSR